MTCDNGNPEHSVVAKARDRVTMMYTGYQNYKRKPSFVAIRSPATAVGEKG